MLITIDPSVKDTVGIMMGLRSSVPVTVEERSKVVIVAHFADFNLRRGSKTSKAVAGGSGSHNSMFSHLYCFNCLRSMLVEFYVDILKILFPRLF